MHFNYQAVLFAYLLGTCRSLFWGNTVEDDDFDASADPNDYGVDMSFPQHHYNGARQAKSVNPMKAYFAKRYERHMQGCYDKYSFRECDANERARLEMSLDQPSHQHNYTEIGFMKRRLPDDLFIDLKNFYEAHKEMEKLEQWPRGNTYVNHWQSPTYMVSFEDTRIRQGGVLKKRLWDKVKPIIEEWTGQELIESSLYGIRVYKNNSILATHVDRLPLVSSCIIQVAQDIDEPWPVEVIGHDRKAHNVTMEPGDMVLYESHSVLHGRPFPLNGRYYANVFVHYIPKNHEANNIQDKEKATSMFSSKKIADKFGGHETQNHDTVTLMRHLADHDEENHGRLRGPQSKGEDAHFQLEDGQTELHIAAQLGDVDTVKRLLDGASPTLLHARDANSWQAVHEAARSGSVIVLRLLVEKGADVTSRTANGGSPLFWAKRRENNQESIEFLESIGAPLYEEETR